jgi:hypothetical protein
MKSAKFIPVIFIGAMAISRAEAQSFEQMWGKSVIVFYDERIQLPNGSSIRQTWSQTVYISTNGNIFLSQKFSKQGGKGLSEQSANKFETMGDREGVGEGVRAKYRWDGSGLTRSWTNKNNGVRLTQTITISEGRCRSSIERAGFGGQVTVNKDDCRIVKGNALKTP